MGSEWTTPGLGETRFSCLLILLFFESFLRGL